MWWGRRSSGNTVFSNKQKTENFFTSATLQCFSLRHSLGMQKILSFKQTKHSQLPDREYLASE